MGNCFGGGSHQQQQQQQATNWAATGVVSLREQGRREVPAAALEVGAKARVLDATGNLLGTGAVDAVCRALPFLARLVLASNPPLASLPDSLGALTALKLLDLSNCSALAALPAAIGQLAQLQTLAAGGCQLQQLPPDIGQLRQLRSLTVAGNRLGGLPPELGACSCLEELDASGNQLAALPAELGGLGKLRALQLDANQLTRLPDTLLLGCTALQTLSLHANPGLTVAVLQSTPGFAEFEARRRQKVDKAIAGGAMLGSAGLDEGVDRPLVAPTPTARM